MSEDSSRKIHTVIVVAVAFIVVLAIVVALIVTRTKGSSDSPSTDASTQAPHMNAFVQPTFATAFTIDVSEQSMTAVADAEWNDMAVAYTKSLDDSPEAIIGVDLATGTQKWTWKLTMAQDETGNPISDAHIALTMNNTTMRLALYSPWVQVVYPDKSGQFAVVVHDGDDPEARQLSSYLYIFRVDDGSVVDHWDLGVGLTSILAWEDGVIVLDHEDEGTDDRDTISAVTQSHDQLWSMAGPAQHIQRCNVMGQSVIAHKWILTADTYIDIKTGKPAPFGDDVCEAWYVQAGDDVYRETYLPGGHSAGQQIEKWDIRNNKSFWAEPLSMPFDLTFSFDGDLIIAIYFDATAPPPVIRVPPVGDVNPPLDTIKAYSTVDGSLVWQTKDVTIATDMVAGDYLVGQWTSDGTPITLAADGSRHGTLPCPSEEANIGCQNTVESGVVLSMPPGGPSLTAYDFTGADPSTPIWSIPADERVYIASGRFVMVDGNQLQVSH